MYVCKQTQRHESCLSPQLPTMRVDTLCLRTLCVAVILSAAVCTTQGLADKSSSSMHANIIRLQIRLQLPPVACHRPSDELTQCVDMFYIWKGAQAGLPAASPSGHHHVHVQAVPCNVGILRGSSSCCCPLGLPLWDNPTGAGRVLHPTTRVRGHRVWSPQAQPNFKPACKANTATHTHSQTPNAYKTPGRTHSWRGTLCNTDSVNGWQLLRLCTLFLHN